MKKKKSEYYAEYSNGKWNIDRKLIQEHFKYLAKLNNMKAKLNNTKPKHNTQFLTDMYV